MNTENKIKAAVYEDGVVAFLDILGFKNKVFETVNNSKCFIKLQEALKSIFEWQNECQKEKDLNRNITVFSDSIVISYALKSTSALFYILIDIMQIQIQLIQYELFVRGGISCGKVYHDDSIIFGPAMIEAYKLEKFAKYPRIILEKKTLITGLEGTPLHDYESEIKDVEELIKMDQDGLFFLDFLSAAYDEVATTNSYEYYEWMKKIQSLLIDAESKFISQPDIHEKYLWFILYFNEVVSRFERLKELIIKTK